MKFITAIFLLLFPLISFAAMPEFVPYTGVEIQWRSISMRGLERSLFSRTASAVHVFAGHKLNEFWNIEGGVHGISTHKRIIGTKVRGLHATMIGLLPINKDKNFKALAGIGFSHLKYSVKHPAYRIDISRVVPKLLGGLQLDFTESVAARVSYHWESAHSIKHKKMPLLRNTHGMSAGLLYSF